MDREPERIAPFMERFQSLWEIEPDMRFIQLVIAVLNHYDAGDQMDPFYMEDEDFWDAMLSLAGTILPHE